MNRVFAVLVVVLCCCCALTLKLRADDSKSAPAAPAANSSSAAHEKHPAVTAPPESYFEKVRSSNRDAAREFYKKYIDIRGLPCTASGEVADEALQRTYEIVTHLLVNRPDVIQAMADNGTRLIIIGKDQVYTDMPEYKSARNPDYLNERVRGTGGFDVTSFGEENLLNLPIDRYDDESIGLHEFCHTIDAALRRIDSSWPGRLRQTYQNAVDKGLWKYAYAGSNQAEYWAEICQSYFDCNRINNWNHAAVATREQLKDYDPTGYELVRTTFKLTPETDWRLMPLRKQPSVIAPPARFKIDPYYTKFTWAREFPVVGSPKVSDDALLKANDTIRKMFAYRHDVLKALINGGAKMVVLAPGEHLADLPEFKDAKDEAGFDNVRCFDYTPEIKLIVVPQENVLGGADDPTAGESLVVRGMAKAAYTATASREPDPKFDTVRGDTQQYEQRLLWTRGREPIKRLDINFDLKLRGLIDAAAEKGLWKGSPAAHDRASYWAAGVEAYFDAAGLSYPPVGAERPIATREQLKAYDPDLFTLVEETMLYDGHQDWRYKR